MLSRRFLGIAGALLALGVVLLVLWPDDNAARAPEASYTLLDKTTHTTAAWRGKVVLVNFWATSCTTCVKEMPALVATHQRFQARGFDTLAVAMQYDPPVYVEHFARARQLPFGVAIDHDGELAKRFGPVKLTPTTLLIDKQGRIVKRYVGEPDFEALHQLIDRLLAA